MLSSAHFRLSVYGIPIIFPLLFCWISCGTVQRWDDDRDGFFRRTRYPWERPTTSTESPSHYYRDSSDDTALKLLIFLPLCIGIFIVFIFRIFFCNCDCDCCDDNSTSATSLTVHAPPRSSSTPRFSAANSNTRQFHTRSMTGSREGIPRSVPSNIAAPNYRSSVSNNASGVNSDGSLPSDKPPDYSVVVISDLRKTDMFPEVKPVLNADTPPPKYDEMDVRKF